MVDRVGNTSVFCYALISEVDLSVFINSYVLKKSVTFDRIVDIWLRFFVKVNNLSVASAQVMTMNIVLTAVGVVLGLYVNIRYKKMVALAEAEN